MRRTLTAAVLLLVALVGAGCGRQDDREPRPILHHFIDAPEVNITVQAITLEATEATEAVAAPETFITVEPAPVLEPVCAHGDHDWRDTEWLLMGERMDVENVRVQACSRCGLLRGAAMSESGRVCPGCGAPMVLDWETGEYRCPRCGKVEKE